MNQAQNAASLPFNIPQAPVAGFSQDQRNAFNTVNNAQGMAQPYFNQANQYFQQSAQGPNVSQFFNPYAGAVTSQLNNIFGQQASQNTGQLTQAAGGVGADRIAVGQANLANQQGLAAGQTLAGLYAPSLSAAQNQQNILQSAGYGTAALGSQAQNAALSGAQAQLGTGGLQQQLQQAQLNSPYQQLLAQAAFPYQQSQFYTGAVGALAPGLGGTTTGQGQTTSPAPSLWSQLIGGAGAATGIAGGLNQAGAFGNNGWLTGGKGSSPSYGGGNAFSGDAYGGSGSNPLPGLSASDYGPGYAPGGVIHPYAEGGGVSDEPTDVAPQSIIPTGQTPHIQDHAPQLNLNPPQQQSGGGGGGGLGDVIKIASMFMARGGAANPYFYEGGDTDVINPDDPVRMTPQEDLQNWRDSVDADMASGRAHSPTAGQPSPLDMANWPYGPVGGPSDAAGAVNQFAGNVPQSQGQALNFAGDGAGAPASGNPYSPPAAAAQDASSDTNGFNNFIKSPWAALTAAGLGIMGGTSPFAGVNIGQGAQQGLKLLEQQREGGQKDETIAQAARRLDLEAKHHEDQYTRMTPYQQFEMSKPFPMGQRIDPITGQSVTTYGTRLPDGTIKPVDPTAAAPNPAAAAADDAAIPANAKAAQGFLIPGKNVPDNVDPSVLAGQDPGIANMVRAIDEGRESIAHVAMKNRYMVQKLLNAYDPGFDASVWSLRNKQQADMSSNGNAGKMLLATNQLMPHLLTASNKAAELANTNYPEANTVKNWLLTATGDPRVKEFQTVREVAATDAAKLLRGTGQLAEKDIEEWRKNIAESGSPQQLQGVIKMLADDLIGARLGSIQGLYRMNMRQEPPEMLWPESKAALAKIKENYVAAQPKKAGAAPAASAVPTAAPATPAVTRPPEVPAGSQYSPSRKMWRTPDGKMFDATGQPVQ